MSEPPRVDADSVRLYANGRLATLPYTVQDLALDLLDARAEITRLNLDAMTTEGQLQEAVASLRAELEALRITHDAVVRAADNVCRGGSIEALAQALVTDVIERRRIVMPSMGEFEYHRRYHKSNADWNCEACRAHRSAHRSAHRCPVCVPIVEDEPFNVWPDDAAQPSQPEEKG